MRPSSSFIGPGSVLSGSHSYWDTTTRFYTYKDQDSIEIGDYCSIGPDVRFIAGGEHASRALSTYPFSLIGGRAEHQAVERMKVGNDVWIGLGATLLGPIVVGDGAIIAAGAVVVKDVQPYTVVAGVPASEVRRRAPESDVRRLERCRWWEWPESDILACESLLRGSGSSEVRMLLEYGLEHGLVSD